MNSFSKYQRTPYYKDIHLWKELRANTKTIDTLKQFRIRPCGVNVTGLILIVLLDKRGLTY